MEPRWEPPISILPAGTDKTGSWKLPGKLVNEILGGAGPSTAAAHWTRR